MSSTPIPTPPADLSGGYMVLQYTNGTDTHKMKVHTIPFGSTPSGANNTYTYSGAGGLPAHTETDTNATFAALGALWAPYYNNAWTLTVAAIYVIASGVPTQLPIIPSPAAVTGTNSTATTGIARAAEKIFNFRTTGGNRARFILVGSAAEVIGVPIQTVANSGGNADQQLVAYLTGNATAITAHDGTKMLSPAKQTLPYNRRLRRHYGFA